MRSPPTGLLVRRQGKGTFVATHAEAQVQYRFLRLMPDQGAREAMQRRFLDFRRLRAPADIARALDLKAGDGVLQLRRLLLSGDTPVVLDDIWLPARLFKGLTAERLQAYRGPMYGLFEAEFGVQMIRAEEKIRAVAAGEAEAALLGVAAAVAAAAGGAASPSPMPTGRWNCAAACTAPRHTTIATS